MTRRLRSVPVFLLLAGEALICCGKSSTSEKRVIAETAAAIDACYHWGGEVGDQSRERNSEITQGIARDCPEAQKRSIVAYKLFPANSDLAAKLIELIDVGYFQVAASEKKDICDTAVARSKQEFLASRQEDILFQHECQEQAAKVYGSQVR